MAYVSKVPVEKATNMLIYSSGKAQRKIAEEMKRSPTFLSAYITCGRTPSVKIFTEIAKVCGWKVQIVSDKGETYVLEA